MWYERWFAHEDYLLIYSHRDEEEAERAIELILRAANAQPGWSFLDLACGNGRHALALARKGFRVVGVDLSANLLDKAREAAARDKLDVEFVRADMRDLEWRGEFDAVLNLFTSFGYFPSEEEDENILRASYRALKPGGWFVLDFFNAGAVTGSLVPRDERRIDGHTVIQERAIRGNRVVKRITISANGETRTFTESVRLYRPEDLRALLARAGFTVQREFGDYDGNPLLDSSPRCILFGRK